MRWWQYLMIVLVAIIATAIVLLLSTVLLIPATAHAYPVAQLHRSATVYVHPGRHRIGSIPHRQSGSHDVSVMPIQRTARYHQQQWLQVWLPYKSSYRQGWIQQETATTATRPYQIVVHRQQRRALVYRHGKLTRKFSVVVGKSTTPTPRGSFFVTERVPLGYHRQAGPWALITSAYSPVLQDYLGGIGQIALHGRVGLTADPLGSAASHGCVRLSLSAIRWLAQHAQAGTIVRVV